MYVTHKSMKNNSVRGCLELYGVKRCGGSTYPTEAEEQMYKVREYFEIIGYDEDIKVTLVKTMLIDAKNGGLH